MLKEETDRVHGEEMGLEEDGTDAKEEFGGIVALAQTYRASIARLDRNALLAKCNEVMEEYEESEEAQRLAREEAANQPDEDGFITVTSKSVGVEEGKQDFINPHRGEMVENRLAGGCHVGFKTSAGSPIF